MSKPEKPEPKTGKRIMSKAEYVYCMTSRLALRLGSIGAASLGIICFLVALVLLVCGFMMMAHDVLEAFICFAFAMTFGWCGVSLMRLTEAGIIKAEQEESVALLTRANTGDLPAPDSLVRASEQPLQAQETILLRAATQGSETPAEQLVRPAGGQQNR